MRVPVWAPIRGIVGWRRYRRVRAARPVISGAMSSASNTPPMKSTMTSPLDRLLVVGRDAKVTGSTQG
jgi:hypothetical protein